jgi:hypothetical protein
MLGPGLGPPAVGPQRIRVDAQLVREPGHHHWRYRRHLVRHESQPRQRTINAELKNWRILRKIRSCPSRAAELVVAVQTLMVASA